MPTKADLEKRLLDLEAENIELRIRAGELPELPRNSEGLPFAPPRLITARMLRGISVAEMAKKMHMSKPDYIGLESALIAPSIEQIGNMSMLLHLPIRFFFAEDVWLIDFDSTSLGPYPWDADSLHMRKWMR